MSPRKKLKESDEAEIPQNRSFGKKFKTETHSYSILYVESMGYLEILIDFMFGRR